METFWLSLFSGGVAIGAVVVLILVLAVALWISILIHELGHVLLAWLCRFAIFEFRVGKGRPAVTRQIGRCQLHLGPWATCGLVRYFPAQMRFYRLRALAAVSGGPLANAATFAVGFWIMSRLDIPAASGAQVFKFTLGALTYLSALITIEALLPYRPTVFGRKYDSDGLQILKLTFGRYDRTLPAHAFCLFHGGRLFDAGDKKRAARWLRRALRQSSLRNEHATVLGCSSLISEAGYTDEARELLRGILEATRHDPLSPLRRDAADNLGSLAIYHHRPDFLPEALQVLREVVADFPSVITLRGTLGGVLYESGEIEEAEAMLEEVLATTTAGIDRSISAAYLACIWRDRGDDAKAQSFIERALQDIPPSGLPRGLVERLTQKAAPHDTPVPIHA